MIRLATAVLLLFLGACQHNPPAKRAESATATLTMSAQKAWDRALNALVEGGHTITASSKESGIITTGGKYVRLNETNADCGNMLGIPFLMDSRAQTVLAYTVRLVDTGSDQSRVIVTTKIEGKFTAHAGAPTQFLECESLGVLERELIGKINH